MRSMLDRPLPRFSLVAMSLAAALAWPAANSAAQDVVLFQDVPSVAELNAVLFGSSEEAAAPMKTRAIRFHDEPAPARPPAASTGQVASTAGSVPTPAPPPPAGTALGLNILFEFDSTNVLAESIPYLERLGEVLSLPENQEKVVSVIGHTDASGGAAYNQSLSEQRALAVGQYLVDVWQVDPSRLAVEGRGKAQPLAGTDPYDGMNRRVEFYAIE
jgi:outer membrane protein OmpA-like peptidoglycan-associated protein